MERAVVVDKDYGSVSSEELEKVRAAYAQAGLKLDTQHFITEEEIISGCQGAIAILATRKSPYYTQSYGSVTTTKICTTFWCRRQFH